MATLPEQEAARTSKEEPIDSSCDHRRIDTGWNLVKSLEKQICGSRFVGSASIAEGYGIAGLQSSSFSRKIPGLVSYELLDRPLVHHARFDSDTLLDSDLSCVLVAGTHQEALHHSIVAHAISRKTNRPVVALQDQALSDSLGRVVWPGPEAIAATQQTSASEVRLTSDGLDPTSAIEEVFGSIRQTTGIEASPLKVRGQKEAVEAIVAMGSVLGFMEDFSDDSCSLLSVHLLRPFPEASFRKLLKGKKKIFYPYFRKSSIYQELLEKIEAIAMNEKIDVVPIELPHSGNPLESTRKAINEVAERPLIPGGAVSFTQNIGVSPGGSWGKRVLLDALSVHTQPPSLDGARLIEETLMTELINRTESEQLDVLVLLQTDAVDPQLLLQRLSRTGVLLLGGTEDAPEAWNWMGEAGRKFVVEQEVELHWMPVGDDSAEVSQVLVRCFSERGFEIDRDDPTIEKLDPETLSASLDSPFESFVVSGSLPLLEVSSGDEEEEKTQTEALSFHFSSGREFSGRPQLPLAPAALLALRDQLEEEDDYPLLISDERVVSLQSFLKEKVAKLAESGNDLSLLSRSLDGFAQLISDCDEPHLTFKEAVEAAFDRVPDYFDLSSEALSKLKSELEALKPSLLVEAVLVGLDSQAYFHLLDQAVVKRRTEYRQRWISEIEAQIVQLDNLLRSDRELSSEYSTADAIDSSIGEGGHFIDTALLSKALPAKRGSTGLGEGRRQRIEQSKKILTEFLKELSQLPLYFVIQGEDSTPPSGLIGTSLRHSDPFGLAQGLHSGFQAKAVDAVRASRVASLEISGSYDESIHDQRLADFTLDACSEEELLSLPPVVVSTTSEFLSKEGFTSFTRVLRSGQPVYVLISAPDLPGGEEQERGILDGNTSDFGYLSIAHREAFVLQAPVSQFQTLSDGLGRMLERLRPGVAVVGLPDVGESFDPNEVSPLSLAARTLPTFEYDPDAGESWADRFSLIENPQVEKVFSEVKIEHIDSSGEKGQLIEKVTFGHRLAMDSRFRTHFKVGVRAQEEDLIELGKYLEDFQQTPPEGIPYIWVIGDNFTLEKALVTREVVHAARSRQKGWRVLQELGGLNNEYVLEAIESTRKEVEAKVEAEKNAALKKARSEGATEAVDRLVAILMNPEAAQSLPSIERPSANPAGQPPETRGEQEQVQTDEVEEAESPAEQDAEEEEFIEDPYIDSYLCTSCNDCINLNPRMFKYNEDNQAFIADLEAGTYLELVKAAEACPANCIHPGAPRAGDETATEEVIGRAKALQ